MAAPPDGHVEGAVEVNLLEVLGLSWMGQDGEYRVVKNIRSLRM